MTVKYNLAVSTSKPWTLFKLLFRWSGSIWKSVFLELLVWLILFAIISIVYRTTLSDSQMLTFEQFVHYCDEKLDYIPLNFMLGFFVTSVLSRWLLFFDNIGYIDNIALMVSAYVEGADEKTRMLRRNIVRYCVLSQALVFRDISLRVRKRFPTIESLITAGFMMEHEKGIFEEFSQFRYNRYWMPFQWSLSLCYEARMKQKIASDILLEKIGEEIKKFRTNMAVLCNYDWVPLPIMYPQLIVMAVHTYFIVCVFSRQFVITDTAPNKTEMDIYFPLMTVLQFIFYMGWLKVAEAMLNPFGEDDDDFECNFLLDKNLSIGLTVVDQGYNKTPEVQQDIFWNDEVRPLYTVRSIQEEQPRSGLTGSTANVIITERSVNDFEMLPLPAENDESLPHNHSFGFIQNALRRAISSKASIKDEHRGSISSKVIDVYNKFSRSMSQSHVSNTVYAPTENRRHQSVANASSVEKGIGGFGHVIDPRERRDSLSTAIDAMIRESNAYGNSAVVNEQATAQNKKDSDNPFSFPTDPLFHLGHYYSHAPHVLTSHKLEDLVEENEDITTQRKSTLVDISKSPQNRDSIKCEMDAKADSGKEERLKNLSIEGLLQRSSSDELSKKNI